MSRRLSKSVNMAMKTLSVVLIMGHTDNMEEQNLEDIQRLSVIQV